MVSRGVGSERDYEGREGMTAMGTIAEPSGTHNLGDLVATEQGVPSTSSLQQIPSQESRKSNDESEAN
jgi:hypothetical protein